MQLYNSLTKKLEPLEPKDGKVRIYSCGPTVYERAHIGNLASFVYADTLRRAVEASGYEVEHVMNITDVDDKTIRNSREQYPDLPPMEALKKLTSHYEQLFIEDLKAVGVATAKIKFVRATDNIDEMQELIRNLLEAKVAYEADDGIYFSISEYKSRGKKYGQLVDINTNNTSQERINNDEYDKDNPHDFVLWKSQKPNEPAWDFNINGKNIAGRPGWHIECSAMSVKYLGQPFDIHTGGVDLKFPHHENEIAQSTALNGDLLAKLFFHSEHMLIDNQKMSKSLNNFLTLEDIKEKGFDPLAFRLFVLEGKYSNQRSFSWDNIEAAQNRLKNWQKSVDILWQEDKAVDSALRDDEFEEGARKNLEHDLDTPDTVALVDEIVDKVHNLHVCKPCLENILETIHSWLGINLTTGKSDITFSQKEMISAREAARENHAWQKSDELRDKLAEQGIGINDTPNGPVWYRL